MKRLLLMFLLAWMGATLFAQQATPVILISAQGKVCYKSPDNKKKQKAITGAVLKRQGAINLSNNSVVTLYCDGKFVEKSGKQLVSLLTVFPEGDNMVKPNFDLTFGDYTMAAFMMAVGSNDKRDGWGIDNPKGGGDGWGGIDNPKGGGDGWGGIDNPKGGGDGWGIDNPKGGGDGWGGKGASITSIQPFGRVFPETMRFYWSKPIGNDAFHVEIRDKNNHLVMETTTQDTFWVVDLKNAAFKVGSLYDWTVSSVNSNPTKAQTKTFEIGKQEGRDQAIQLVQKGELFSKSPEAIKLVMQAVALETNGWFEEASRLYTLAQEKEPKNAYVKLMHSAFWLRCGLKPKARGVYR